MFGVRVFLGNQLLYCYEAIVATLHCRYTTGGSLSRIMVVCHPDGGGIFELHCKRLMIRAWVIAVVAWKV